MRSVINQGATMDDFGNDLFDGYDWLITLFPYFPDAASMTAEGNLYDGH